MAGPARGLPGTRKRANRAGFAAVATEGVGRESGADYAVRTPTKPAVVGMIIPVNAVIITLGSFR